MHELLPLGSVVFLKQGTTPLMIIGYYPWASKNGKKSTYLCVIYPFGLDATKKIVMINEEEIQEVKTQGYATRESQLLNLVLQEAHRRYGSMEKAPCEMDAKSMAEGAIE